jgi:hypothetical protein
MAISCTLEDSFEATASILYCLVIAAFNLAYLLPAKPGSFRDVRRAPSRPYVEPSFSRVDEARASRSRHHLSGLQQAARPWSAGIREQKGKGRKNTILRAYIDALEDLGIGKENVADEA